MREALENFDPRGTYGAAAHDYAAVASRWQFLSDRALADTDLEAGARLLDVACGPGGTTIAAASIVGPAGEVVAIDIAPEMLDIVRQRATAAGLANITLVEGDMMRLGERPACRPPFDAVVCVLGLFFADDMVDAARAMWERVAPQGTLAITTLGPGVFSPMLEMFLDVAAEEHPTLDIAQPWRRTERPDVVLDVLHQAGLSTIEVHEGEGQVSIDGPGGWWSLVMGSGLRRIVAEIGPDAAARVRSRTDAWLAERQLTTVKMTGLHFSSIRE